MQNGRGKQIGHRGDRWAAVALALMAALAIKLFFVQVVYHQAYVRKAQKTRGRAWPIRAPRGNIYDRNGNPLALNLKLFSVAADPGMIGDPVKAARRLSPLLKMPEAELQQLLAKNTRYVRLREAVDEQVAKAIHSLNY